MARKPLIQRPTPFGHAGSLEIRIVFAKPRDAAAKKDTLVAEVQKTLEADIALGGAGRILNGGDEELVLGADSDQTHKTILRYGIEYTRRIADQPFPKTVDGRAGITTRSLSARWSSIGEAAARALRR